MTKLVSSENLTSFGQQFLSHLSTVATTGSFYDLTDVPEEYAQEYQAFNLYTRTSSSDTAPSLPATTDWKWYTAENKIASAADSSVSVVGIWSSVVPQPTGTNIYLWSTSGSFRSGDGTMTSAWQPAYCMTGAKGETGEQGGRGETGEKGEKGDSGNFVSICFTRTNLDLTAQENAAYLPTGGTYSSPIPTTTVSGTTVWSDGIPTGDASLWMTKCTFSTDTTTPVWSTPSKATDTADVDFEYSSLATPGNPNNASSLTTDWHDGSEATAADIWMAMRTYKNGVWTEFIVFKIKGEDGKDGETGPAGTDGVDGAFTAICFTRTNLDLTDSLNAQYLPTGGSYVSPIPTTLVDGNFVWSDGIPSGESILWMTTCTIHPSDETLNWSVPKQATDTATLDFEYSSLDEPRDPNNATYLNADWHNTPTALDIWMALRVCKNGEWSQFSVFKIKGEDGTDGINGQDGQDGEFDKFIYKLCNSQTEFDNLTTPTGTAPEFDDTVWSDNALSLTAAGQIVAYSYSHKDSNGWSAWSTPKAWSAWGNNGTDGDGVQYIYYVTGSSSLANNQMPSNLAASIVSSSQYQTKNAEFIPTTGMALEGGGTLACTWTDNPTGVSETTQYEYVSVRRYINGTWSAFSVPKLWAYHATDGVDGIVTNYLIVPTSSSITKVEDNNDYYPQGSLTFQLYNTGTIVNGANFNRTGNQSVEFIVCGSNGDTPEWNSSTNSFEVSVNPTIASGAISWDDDNQFAEIIWRDENNKILSCYIIPIIVPGQKGADGQDGQTQSLTGIVLRVSNWTASGDYNDGTVAEDGVYYQDVVYYDGRYYKCVSTNYSTTPDVDPAFESFSIASDAAFNTILANSAYVKGLTTQQVVLTDNNNTIVGGMTSSSAIPNSDIEDYTIGSVRIWAGTPSTTGDLSTAPFTVTNAGKLTATDAEISGSIEGSTQYIDYSLSDAGFEVAVDTEHTMSETGGMASFVVGKSQIESDLNNTIYHKSCEGVVNIVGETDSLHIVNIEGANAQSNYQLMQLKNGVVHGTNVDIALDGDSKITGIKQDMLVMTSNMDLGYLVRSGITLICTDFIDLDFNDIPNVSSGFYFNVVVKANGGIYPKLMISDNYLIMDDTKFAEDSPGEIGIIKNGLITCTYHLGTWYLY